MLNHNYRIKKGKKITPNLNSSMIEPGQLWSLGGVEIVSNKNESYNRDAIIKQLT